MSPCSIALVLALASTAAPAPDDSPVYRWRFEKDRTFYQEVITDTQQVMKVMGNEVTQTQKQTLYLGWTPLRQEGPNWVIRQRIEGVKLEIDVGGQKLVYDSTVGNGGANPLADFLKAMVGSEFTLTLDRDMKVIKIGGREAFVNRLGAVNPGMDALLGQLLSEDALKGMADPTFSALPPRPLEKGESWAKAYRMDMGPVGRYHITYEYLTQGREGRFARFKVDNIGFKYEPPDKNDPALPFVINQASLDGKKGSGMIWFDVEKGRLDRAEMSLEIQGQLDIGIGGQNTTLELRQVQKTTTRITEASPLKK